MTTIIALVVAFHTLTKATKNETRILTRNMGFNVRIIPGESDMNKFWIWMGSNRKCASGWCFV